MVGKNETDLELSLHDLDLILVVQTSVPHDHLMLRVKSCFHLGEPREVFLYACVELLEGVEGIL